MNYIIFKLTFLSPVHFGKESLDDSESSFCADMLFSSLCHEAINNGTDCLNKLVDKVKSGNILFSDAFPYISDDFFVPKPYLLVESSEKSGNSLLKKAYKKLKYIPVNGIDDYLRGEFDVLNAVSVNQLGINQTRISASVRRENETLPYEVGCFSFNTNCGLYYILAYENKDELEMIISLVTSLSYSGIGGKRHSGFGRFSFELVGLPEGLQNRITADGSKYMTLSIGLPKDYEMEDALENAQYQLVKRSGFISSKTYSSEQRRKRDIYLMSSGSCFGKRFSGDIYDVSDGNGSHPVYRYAKPIYMEVGI